MLISLTEEKKSVLCWVLKLYSEKWIFMSFNRKLLTLSSISISSLKFVSFSPEKVPFLNLSLLCVDRFIFVFMGNSQNENSQGRNLSCSKNPQLHVLNLEMVSTFACGYFFHHFNLLLIMTLASQATSR